MSELQNELIVSSANSIQKMIYTIRGVQVMLDSDLAKLYGVETKMLNKAVKRNRERFPEQFMFRLSKDEWEKLRFQIGTSNREQNSLNFQNGFSQTKRGGRRYLPYVFTEQGVAMLSAVLRSETAVKVSIRIMEAFVAMRHFMQTNAQIFQRLETLEMKQIIIDKKVDQVLSAMEMKKNEPKQGIFFDGQIFDAYKFVSEL
ncbi:MAG TPA: ORF6N domain-containing protein, partial [Caldithrix abyssi]|nr:ORF6N domain-containing protein [Caldithrix abyssi]